MDVPHATITASRPTPVAGMRSAWSAPIYMKLLMGTGDSPRHGLQIGKETLPIEKEELKITLQHHCETFNFLKKV